MPKIKGSLEYTDVEKGIILALRSEGKRFSFIGKQLNRDPSAIRRFILANTNKDGKLEIVHKVEKRGRKRKTSDRDDREIVRAVKLDRFMTAKKLKTGLGAL